MALYQSSSVFFCIGMWNLKNFSLAAQARPARPARPAPEAEGWPPANMVISRYWSPGRRPGRPIKMLMSIPKYPENPNISMTSPNPQTSREITNKSRTNHLNHFNKSSDGDFCTRKSLWLLQEGTGEIREWSGKEMVTAPEKMWKVPSEHQNIGLWPLNTADDLGRCAKILLVVWDHRLVDSAVFSATS